MINETALKVFFISWIVAFIACSISFWKDVCKTGRLTIEDLIGWLLVSVTPIMNLLGVWVLISESFQGFGRWVRRLGRMELWRRK